MMKIFVIAEIPDDLGQHFCQHIRNFDVRFSGRCEFNMFAVAPGKSVEEMKQMLNINPSLPIKVKIKNPDEPAKN